MCGIAGVVKQNATVNKEMFRAMVTSLRHRGPDDEGIEFFCDHSRDNQDFHIALGHRRLSIIDLSDNGHQPMKNEDGSLWIVYNGEIYNYQSLRKELVSFGHYFQSGSDTEVIIHAYEQWGVECLHKFSGMFAFAILDRNKRKVFLAKDRFGIKPLYYCTEGYGSFLFSSEVRPILNSGFIRKRINPLAVDSFLAYGAVQAPFTIIEEIYSLLPAHYLIYDIKTCHEQTVQYWSPVDTLSEEPLNNETKAIQSLRDILQDSVEKHLVSDVPVGLFLSGGIDSSSIVSLANKVNKGSLQSFSVTFPESSFSEGKYSQLIADQYCKNHTEIKLSAENLLHFLPQAIEAMDQPTIDGINVYTISKVVRETGIKAVLSGQGGDEIFGGYPNFKRIPLIKRIYHIINLLPFSANERMGHMIDLLVRSHSVIWSKSSQIFQSDGDVLSLYLILRQLLSSNERINLTEENSNGKLVNGLSLQVEKALNEEMKQLDLFNKISLLEMRLYLSNMLLRDGDFMSMAHGLEVRVPFLNHELVEFVFNIAPRIKLQKGYPKALLVKSLGELIPREIYMRPKMGFVFPWEIWLKNQLRAQIEELIFGFPEDSRLRLNLKNCQLLWHKFLQNESGVTWARVWAIYILLSWIRINFEK